ncbi:MAG: transglutaminase domain-containing protein [Candidatus Choladocola sp.]|nr:transglutaminase domain-containing protein [Candidatus Choladocola sp.]
MNYVKEKQTGRGRRKAGRMICCSVMVFSAVLMGICTTGCGIVERVKYEWSGSGVEGWENAALEEGIVTNVEEYYYDHLSDELREAYREIYVRVMRGEDTGDFMSSISVDDFWTAYYAMLADHPEIFWLGSSAQVEESGLTGSVVSYNLEVAIPAEARDSMRQQLEAAADACISQISPEASDYEKIKYVYEYIINTTDYSAGSADSQNIQSVLLYHSSVCAGYSKTFQYILNRMGLFCTYITGKTTNGGEHGWNMVRIDGQYYYVDVTWGDPVFANQMDASGSNVTNYNYLCCTEYDLFKTHIPDDSIELPSCTSDAYNYYKLTGRYYENFDYNTIYNVLMESVWAGETNIVMKFGSREAYETAQYELFSNNMLKDPGEYLMEINGVNSWNYRYNTDDNFYLITLYWY